MKTKDYMEHEHPYVLCFTVSARKDSSELTQALDGHTLRFAYGWTDGTKQEKCWIPQIPGYFIEDFIYEGDLIQVEEPCEPSLRAVETA